MFICIYTTKANLIYSDRKEISVFLVPGVMEDWLGEATSNS